MILIIGGCWQGKTEYALQQFHLTVEDVFECTEEPFIGPERRILTHIERIALGCVRRGLDAPSFWQQQMPALTDRILIADDISSGIVPVDPLMRAWREAAGRAGILLASRAERVIRVFCGLGQVIK